MKSHTRLLASILVIATIASTTGCSKKNNDSLEESNVYEDISFETTLETNENKVITEVTNTFETESVLENTDVVLETTDDDIASEDIEQTKDVCSLLYEYLYDENIDYNLVIENYVNNYEIRSEIKDDYLRAIYMLMYNSSFDISIYLEELHTMVLMQQVPMCVSEEVWFNSFKHLISLNPECSSLFDTYSEFAIFVHSLTCNKEHTLNEFGSYTCPELDEEYSRKLTIDII